MKKHKLVLIIFFMKKYLILMSSINDFIEMNFRISLETDSISLINYIKVIYEIFDENNNSLYIQSNTLNQYKHFQKYVFIKESIFLNFDKITKSIKFVIKFVQVKSNIIFMYYLNNKYYRFILKHYST